MPYKLQHKTFILFEQL